MRHLASCGRPGPVGAHPGWSALPTALCLTAWGWRGGTHCALAALRSNSHRESVTKRATRAQPQAARHSHPGKSPPLGQAYRSHQSCWSATVGVPTVLLPRRVRPGAGAPDKVPRSADAVAARFSALRHLACGGCPNGARQARSEFRRVATASSIAGKPVRRTGHLVEAPAPGRTRLEPRKTPQTSKRLRAACASASHP